MWPLGAVAGTAGAIPSSGDGVGRGACGEGLGFARDLFGPELGVETAGGGAHGGARRRRPLRPTLRRGVRQGGAVRGGGSSGRLAVGATGSMGSAAAAAMADGGELGVGVRFCLVREHRHLYRRVGLPMRAHSY
jgi:hypothetical protein